MRIIEISYHEKGTGWTIENMRFDQFNLLVGISGVGKTRILEAIRTMAEIAHGKSFNGVKWSMVFEIKSKLYFWSGEFEYRAEDDPVKRLEEFQKLGDEEYRFIEEVLAVDGKTYFDRRVSGTFFEGQKIPKVSPAKSVLHLFSDDETIDNILFRFKNYLLLRDSLLEEKTIYSYLISEICALIKDGKYDIVKVPSISEVELLAVAEKMENKLFNTIKQQFKTIFPQIEDLKFIETKNKRDEEILKLVIIEKNTDWFPVEKLSSGMLKTLNLLLSFYFMHKGSVVLIDEFENSLGINCIDEIAGIMTSNTKVQYIITSHHPYIINKIDMKHWKIVQRDGSKVFLSTAKELKLGRSRHQAFKQLLNSEAYTDGIKH